MDPCLRPHEHYTVFSVGRITCCVPPLKPFLACLWSWLKLKWKYQKFRMLAYWVKLIFQKCNMRFGHLTQKRIVNLTLEMTFRNRVSTSFVAWITYLNLILRPLGVLFINSILSGIFIAFTINLPPAYLLELRITTITPSTYIVNCISTLWISLHTFLRFSCYNNPYLHYYKIRLIHPFLCPGWN